jgi:hypothetical protein
MGLRAMPTDFVSALYPCLIISRARTNARENQQKIAKDINFLCYSRIMRYLCIRIKGLPTLQNKTLNQRAVGSSPTAPTT